MLLLAILISVKFKNLNIYIGILFHTLWRTIDLPKMIPWHIYKMYLFCINIVEFFFFTLFTWIYIWCLIWNISSIFENIWNLKNTQKNLFCSNQFGHNTRAPGECIPTPRYIKTRNFLFYTFILYIHLDIWAYIQYVDAMIYMIVLFTFQMLGVCIACCVKGRIEDSTVVR